MSVFFGSVLCRARRGWRRGHAVQQMARYYVKPKKKGIGGSTQAWITLSGVVVAIIGGAVYYLGKPEEQIAGMRTEPDKYANENVVKAYLRRAWDTLKEFRKSYTEPSSEKLLPDLLPPQYQRPYTLLIEPKDIFMHSEYDRTVGWKHQKRPGLEFFLKHLFEYYEIVVFSSEVAFAMHPIIDKLDPNMYIMYRLYRDSTKYMERHHVKDLSGLNRSLNRVIILDTDSQSVKLQPENSIILGKWTGDTSDKTLFDMVPFLLTIATNGVEDVRPVLDYYKSQGDHNFLDTFKANQARLREMEETQKMKRQGSVVKSRTQPGGSISPFSLGSLSRQYSQQEPEADSYSSPSPIDSAEQPFSPPTQPKHTDEEGSSLARWIGSWIGWK